MAGYLGTKAVLLSTTAANVTGTVTADAGQFDTSLNVDGTVTADGLTVDGDVTITQTAGGTFLKFDVDGTLDEATIGMDTTDLIISVDPTNARASSDFIVKTDGVEAMRIDSSGNLLVGTTDTTPYNNSAGTSADQGFVVSGGRIFAATNANSVSILNRTSTDGDIVQFRKDGSVVGSIESTSSGQTIGINLYPAGNVGLRGATASIIPFGNGSDRDNAIDLGRSTSRFDDIYATNGTIQTSDRNEKQDIASLTPTEMLVAARLSTGFKNFRWKDSVAEKGAAARMHSGAIAQDVQDAFTAEGLEAGDYSMFISATWWTHDVDVPAVEAVAEVVDEDGVVVTEAVEAVAAYTRTDTYDTEAEAPVGAVSKTRLGVRYPELLSFVAAYNEQRFASIEARLTALEAV